MAVDMTRLFAPRSLALVGASNSFMKWGFIVLANILSGGYKGKIYPVNPRGGKILGLDVYKDLRSIPDEIDVVVVTTPAAGVPGAARQCAAKKVPFMITITAGFSESGDEGKRLEREVAEIVRGSGVRMVGPNTMGIVGTGARLCALMPPVKPQPGAISFVAQSGNIGSQLLGLGQVMGVGFHNFVASGNEGDLRVEDYIEFFGEDEKTRVIMAYIEGVDDGRRFLDVVRRITPRKPVIVFKAGQTRSGARAAVSHTGALAGSRDIYDAAFRQAGVIKVSATDEMLDLARAFAYLPLPKGNRVGIVTWGGGWGVVTADACEDAGLNVVPLPTDVIAKIDSVLPPYWSRGNPVDLVGTLNREAHRVALELIVGCPSIDGIIALGIFGAATFFSELVANASNLSENVPPELVQTYMKEIRREDEKFESTVVTLMDRYNKPIVGATVIRNPQAERDVPRQVLVFSTPEKAARALWRLYEYQRYRESVHRET
ncbi:MAG: CoA-binding protein [bacterium]